MFDLYRVNQFIRDVSASREMSQLYQHLDSITRELGFRHFALVQHVDIRVHRSAAVWLHSYPESWVARSVNAGRYSTDPIHVASYRTGIGFRWGQLETLIELNSEHRQTLEEASRHGICDGFTVPTHVPGEVNGTCSFAISKGMEIDEYALPAAQLVGAYAFDAALRIMRQKRGNPEFAQTRLTPRQLDCIALLAKGKSDWEISRVLGVSEDTVSAHLNDARRRYGVARRVQLVTHALYDGHLTLTDALC